VQRRPWRGLAARKAGARGGGRRSAPLDVLASRSVAHAGGEGRARTKGAEDVPARGDCGGVEARATSAPYPNPSGEQAGPGLGCAGGFAAG
jgi:hypothetical protein